MNPTEIRKQPEDRSSLKFELQGKRKTIHAYSTEIGKLYYCSVSKIYFLRMRAKNEFLCLNEQCRGTTKILPDYQVLEEVKGTLTFVIKEE